MAKTLLVGAVLAVLVAATMFMIVELLQRTSVTEGSDQRGNGPGLSLLTPAALGECRHCGRGIGSQTSHWMMI
jgi:hypothetical protein